MVISPEPSPVQAPPFLQGDRDKQSPPILYSHLAPVNSASQWQKGTSPSLI